MRDISRPVVCAEKKAADWPRMWRNSTLRRVAHDALPDIGHQILREIRADALDEIHDQDRDDRRDQPLARGQHAVEDRLDRASRATPTQRRRAPSPPARPPAAPDGAARTRERRKSAFTRSSYAVHTRSVRRTIRSRRSVEPCACLCQRHASRRWCRGRRARRPAEVLPDPLRRRVEHGRIAGTPRRRAPRHRRPVTRSTAAITSLTDDGRSVPTL